MRDCLWLQVDQEVQMAQRHARRMSVDARKMSVGGGGGAGDAAAAAAAAHSGRAMQSLPEVSEISRDRSPARGGNRGGRRGSVSVDSGSQDDSSPRATSASRSTGGRRGSIISADSMQDGGTNPRTGGRRASISSASDDQSALLETPGPMSGDAFSAF